MTIVNEEMIQRDRIVAEETKLIAYRLREDTLLMTLVGKRLISMAEKEKGGADNSWLR